MRDVEASMADATLTGYSDEVVVPTADHHEVSQPVTHTAQRGAPDVTEEAMLASNGSFPR